MEIFVDTRVGFYCLGFFCVISRASQFCFSSNVGFALCKNMNIYFCLNDM